MGTISTEKEAFDWLNQTYYGIRVKRNPQNYSIYFRDKGLSNEQKVVEIETHLREKVQASLEELDRMKLIRYDRKNFFV